MLGSRSRSSRTLGFQPKISSYDEKSRARCPCHVRRSRNYAQQKTHEQLVGFCLILLPSD
jgi:hypothetical protein